MKILLTVLALLNGGYMLVDGIYVMIRGKYIGPERPGPWANLFERMQVDVFKLGPLFVLFGLTWLILAYGLLTSQGWAYWLGLIISIGTLWYLSIGTIISIIVFVLLLIFRSRLGL